MPCHIYTYTKHTSQMPYHATHYTHKDINCTHHPHTLTFVQGTTQTTCIRHRYTHSHTDIHISHTDIAHAHRHRHTHSLADLESVCEFTQAVPSVYPKPGCGKTQSCSTDCGRQALLREPLGSEISPPLVVAGLRQCLLLGPEGSQQERGRQSLGFWGLPVPASSLGWVQHMGRKFRKSGVLRHSCWGAFVLAAECGTWCSCSGQDWRACLDLEPA